ncbi:MAG TPA: hypothetical protein DCQ20_10860, partial [Nitrospira sp.]|nr:hypothetical protein [Nitrospira sp.]
GVHKRDALYSARREPQRLNVPQGYAYAPSLAAALLDELFAHPAYTLMINAPHKLIPACYAKIDLFAAC